MSDIPDSVPIILNDEQICYFKYSDIKLYSSYSEYIASIFGIEDKSNLCINIRINPVIIDSFTVEEKRKIIHLSLFGLTKELTDLQMKNCNVYMLTSILLVIDYVCQNNKENFKWNKKIENEIILKIHENIKFNWVQLLVEINSTLPNLANEIIDAYLDGLLYFKNEDECMKIINNIPQVSSKIMFKMQQNLKYYRECQYENEHIIELAKEKIVNIEKSKKINKKYDHIYKNCSRYIEELDNLLSKLENNYY